VSSAFYSRPVDKATALFFGGQNFISGEVNNGVFASSFGQFQLHDKTENGLGTLTIRPENIRIDSGSGGSNSVVASIVEKIYMGTQTRLQCQVGDTLLQVIANPNDVEGYTVGQDISLALPAQSLWVLRS